MSWSRVEKSRAVCRAVLAGYCDEIGRPLREHSDRVMYAALRYEEAARSVNNLNTDPNIVAHVAQLHSLLAFRDAAGQAVMTPESLRLVGIPRDLVRRIELMTVAPGETGHAWVERFVSGADFETLLVAVADYEDHIDTLKQSESLYPSPERLHILNRLYKEALAGGYPRVIPTALLMHS